jgi:hypothetical protein
MSPKRDATLPLPARNAEREDRRAGKNNCIGTAIIAAEFHQLCFRVECFDHGANLAAR